jgi:hypothetical protein
VFWGRPSESIKNLIDRVQQELLAVSPSKFVMYSMGKTAALQHFSDAFICVEEQFHADHA